MFQWWGFFLWIVLGLGLVFPDHAFSNEKISTCIERQLNQESLFNPETVLLKKGLDPSKLEFQNSGSTPDNFEMRVIYENKFYGWITLSVDADIPNRIYIDKIEIIPEAQGKGLGTLMYLTAAKISYDKWGLILEQSVLTTNQAKAVWSRLVENGLAEKFVPQSEYPDQQSSRIKLDVLKGNVLIDTKIFFETHSKSEPAPR